MIYSIQKNKKQKIVYKKVFNTNNSGKLTILIFWPFFGLLSPQMAQNRSKYKI